MEKVYLTKLAPNCGCAAKVGPGTLAGVLCKLPKFHDEHLLVGTETSDDAAVYKISDELAMIQTLDFFTPVADDPYDFGQIAAAKRDRVQVDMEIDNGGKEGEHYWFPYSTVASSPDGSGWYCMPENGESVRVYFPVADEKEAYVVTNIKAHEPKEGNQDDPMGNPNVRNIETAQGNQVQFTEEGVVIAAGRKQGSILLKRVGKSCWTP